MANHAFRDMNDGQRMQAVQALIMDPATGAPAGSALPKEATLLAAASATGAAVNWRGGRGTVDVWGTFGGATATFQSSPDGGTTWIPVGAAGVFTAVGTASFELPARPVRIAISGGSGVSISASVAAP